MTKTDNVIFLHRCCLFIFVALSNHKNHLSFSIVKKVKFLTNLEKVAPAKERTRNIMLLQSLLMIWRGKKKSHKRFAAIGMPYLRIIGKCWNWCKSVGVDSYHSGSGSTGVKLLCWITPLKWPKLVFHKSLDLKIII